MVKGVTGAAEAVAGHSDRLLDALAAAEAAEAHEPVDRCIKPTGYDNLSQCCKYQCSKYQCMALCLLRFAN